jgi:hypothetical protein
VGAEFYHADGGTERRKDGRADGQTDLAKLLVAIRNFANAPKLYFETKQGVRIFLFTICLTALSICYTSLN